MNITRKIPYRKILIAVAASVAVAIAVVLTAWWLHEPTEEELRMADVTVEREERLMITADGDTLFTITGIPGDSIIESNGWKATLIPGEWVNRLPGIPSCGGRIAVVPADTMRLHNADDATIRRIITRTIAHISARMELIKAHEKATSYYLRRHNVAERGFDIVARYDQGIRQEYDSLMAVDKQLRSIKQRKQLSMAYEARYRLLAGDAKDKKSQRKIGADLSGSANDLLTIKVAKRDMKSDSLTCSTRLSLYDKAVAQRIATRSKSLIPPVAAVPSDGFVCHEDSIGYYEGEWKNGMREGFGMGMTAKSKLSVGEWKENVFKGERITYTPNRIYGIDISRHQHEKGRKRYSIDWKNLAITSLGKLSKKTIDGTVDYPISFIYIKSTEGTTIRNRYFSADYAAAHKQGYRVGAYHFFSCRTGGTVQAKYFCKNTRYQKGDLPPVLDIEPSPAQIRKMGGTTAMFANIKAWIKYVEQTWHVQPILYVSQTFVNRYLTSAPDLLHKYDVWIARYGEYKPDVNLIYWQLSPDGRVRGIHGDVDINVFNGFKDEFAELGRE